MCETVLTRQSPAVVTVKAESKQVSSLRVTAVYLTERMVVPIKNPAIKIVDLIRELMDFFGVEAAVSDWSLYLEATNGLLSPRLTVADIVRDGDVILCKPKPKQSVPVQNEPLQLQSPSQVQLQQLPPQAQAQLFPVQSIVVPSAPVEAAEDKDAIDYRQWDCKTKGLSIPHRSSCFLFTNASVRSRFQQQLQ